MPDIEAGGCAADPSIPNEDGLLGTVLDVIDGGSIFLLIVSTGTKVVDQVIEPRYMADIVRGLGLSHPSDLVGRKIELSEDGMTARFPDPPV
ncbi:MAG: hypothetical protein ABFE07_17805, partial [Armatimonadia bacterium]